MYAKANSVWRAEVGYEQSKGGLPLHFLQRICEKGRSFWPLAPNYRDTPFARSFIFYNYRSMREEFAFDYKSGEFAKGFGVGDVNSGFAIYKAGAGVWGLDAGGRAAEAPSGAARVDLVAVNRLVIDAYNSVNDFEPQVPAAGLSKPHY